MAWARRVFPVPVSPSSTTGTSDLAPSSASRRQRAIAALLVVRFSSFNCEGATSMALLLAHVFPQLPDRFECVLDHRPATDDDVRFALHSDPERHRLRGSTGNPRFLKGTEADEMRSLTRAHSGRAYPIEFAADGAVALIRKRFKEISNR